MIRHQFSYWLTANSHSGNVEQANRFVDAFHEVGLLDLGLTCNVEINLYGDYMVVAEVDENVGTIERNNELVELVSKLAARFPNFTVTFDEQNEEDYSEQSRTVWNDGRVTETRHARIIGVEPRYDRETIDAVVTRLREHGFAEAAECAAEMIRLEDDA